MIKTYGQNTQWYLYIVILLSIIISGNYILSWSESGSWISILVIASCFIVTIFCGKPLIENRKISVGNGYIVISDRFSDPVKLFLADSLKQIVMRNEEVRSFRFKSGLKQFQVTPCVYRDGDKITEEILAYIKNKKIVVEVI